MGNAALAPVETSKHKAEPARMPAMKPNRPASIPGIPNFLSAAGNMAIQRAASGPLAGSPAASAILGGANMSGGGCSCGSATCEECGKKPMQRKGEGDASAPTSGFHSALNRSGPGAPLGPHVRSVMEDRFGQSFDDVRVHSDGAAADAARGIHAHAFTTGRDIYFGHGRYEPHSTAGQKLLAHELTHVLQQRQGVVQPGLKSLNATAHDDVFEREAEHVERHFDRHEHGCAAPVEAQGDRRDHSAPSGGKSVQRKCACGGTCSKCSGQPAALVPQEVRKAPVQRKAEEPPVKQEKTRRVQQEGPEQSAAASKTIQRKCACGGTCSKCSGQSSQPAAAAELKPPLQRKAEDTPASAAMAPQNQQKDAAAQSSSPEKTIQRKCACGGTCSKCSGTEEEGKAPAIQRKGENITELVREKANATRENRALNERQGRKDTPRNERNVGHQAGATAQGRNRVPRPTRPGRRPTFAVQRATSAGGDKATSVTRSDKFEREANAAANEVVHGRQVSAEKVSDLGQQSIQPFDWEWCNIITDPDCTLSSTADVVKGEASEIASDVWNAAQDFANFVGGVLEYIDNLLTITIPPMHVCDPHSIRFTLSELEMNLPFLEGAAPLAPGVEVYGEVGLHLGLIPEISLQLGPCETHAITIAIHPISLGGSVSGGFDLTLGLGLGAEARAGIYGEVGVNIIWPDPPIILHAPVVNIQAGLAGFARAMAADQMSIDFSASAGLTGFSFSERRTDNLGFALDLGLAGYGALSVLGANLCTLYWPLYEAHKEAVLSLGFGLDLDVSATSLPSLSINADTPEWNRMDWGDLGIEFERDMFKDDCPLCDFFEALGLFPSQIAGPWPFHPTSPWYGPLPDIYPINPGDKIPKWFGGKCRGACGVDCTKCKDIGDVFVCEQIGDHHKIWKYPHFNICPTHQGCRDHDACYDWCANKLYERGPLGIIFGPCHRMCDFECVCEHSLPDCVNWIFGKGGDGLMMFSERPQEIGGCLGPCPKITKDAAGATALKTCLPDVVLFDRIEGFSDAISRKTPKFPVIAPIIFDIYGVPCIVTVEAFATFEAFISAGLGPAVLKNACMELDLGTGDYHGTAELHVFADVGGLIQIKGGLDAELSVACLISVLKVKPRLIATGTGRFDNDLFVKVDISCCGGSPVLDAKAGITPCLTLAFDLDAALDVDLFGFNLFSEIWNLAHKDWKKCWPVEFDIFSLGPACGKGGGAVMTAGAAPALPLTMVGGGGGPSAGGTGGAAGAATPGAPAGPALASALLGPHDLDDKILLKDLFAMAAHGDDFPDFPADPAADHQMTNPCPVPSAPTGLSCSDAIHMRWYKPNDIYPNPIKLDGINYNMVGPTPAPPPDTHQNVGVDAAFMPSIGKCLELDPQPRVGNQGRYRTLLQNHGFDWNSPTPMQGDHVQDVFWKGPDRFDNLWPLDAFKNQSAGSRQNLHQEIEFAETPGGATKRMSMKDFKKTQWEPDPAHKRRFFKIGEILF